MSQDCGCSEEGDWGGCPSPVTPEFVQQVRRLLAGFVHMLEVEQICFKQFEGPRDITDNSLIQLFHELKHAEELAAAHHKLHNVGHENKCQGEAGRQLFLFKPHIEGFSEKSRSSLSQPSSENLETILTRLINGFIQEFTVRRFINTLDCSPIVHCRFCNKPIGDHGRDMEKFCCDDGAFVSKIWKRLTARNSLKGTPVWDENLLTEVLDYIHNKLSSKYELFGDLQKEIDEYTKQLKDGDYEERYVKNFIKQRLEGHSTFKTRFDGLEAKEVDTSDIFDEQPDEVHLPAGYVSVETETTIQGHAGDIPYGYAQADTMSELQLILNPKDDEQIKAEQEELDKYRFCYKVEPGVTQTDISGEIGDIPYGNARLIICSSDMRLKKYAGLDRNKITIDKEGRMATDSNTSIDKLQENESESDVAARKPRKTSPTRRYGEKRKGSDGDSSDEETGEKKSDKRRTSKKKRLSEKNTADADKIETEEDSEHIDKMGTSKKKRSSEKHTADADKINAEEDSEHIDKMGTSKRKRLSEKHTEDADKINVEEESEHIDKTGTSKKKRSSEKHTADADKINAEEDSEHIDKMGTSKRKRLSEKHTEDADKINAEEESEHIEQMGHGKKRRRTGSESAVEGKGRKGSTKRRSTMSKVSIEAESEEEFNGERNESRTESKSGRGKGGSKSQVDPDTGLKKSLSGKGTSGKGRGRDRDRDRGGDQSGMRGKLGKDDGKSGEWLKKHKSKHDYDDLVGGDLRNTSSRKSRSPIKIKSLKGTCGIKYQLSDPRFIDIGWTILPKYPNEKKLTLYSAVPTKVDKNWFCEGAITKEKFYLDGTVFTRCQPDGSGNVFYPNGSFAISVKRTEEGTYTIAYNPSTNNDIGTVAAIFDSIGNGVVYSPAGKIRLTYTQQKGIYYDTSFKVPIKWHWLITGKIQDIVEVEEKREKKREQFTEGIVKKIEKVFAIKERLASLSTKSSVAKSLISGQTSRQQFDTEKPSAKKSSTRRKSTVVPVPSWNNNGSKVSSEAELIKQEIEKNTSLLLSETSPMNIVSTEFSLEDNETVNATGHKFSPLKSIVLKINKHMSLRIFDQENVNLQINCGKQTLRLELGVHVNPEEIFKELMMDAVELNKYPVICYFELFRPPCLEKTLKLLEEQRATAAEEAIKKFLNNY